MFVSGFTIVRNAIKYDYPVVESIQSLLPLCNEVIVLVGNSEDDTRRLVSEINDPKIKIFDSVWDDTLREGGRVLAVETDKAKSLVSKNADWCIYLQADETLHDEDYTSIRLAMEKYAHEPKVEGLLFHYRHFFGNFNFLAHSRTFYRNEIRIIKNLPNIASYKDAQGFRINGQKLKVKQIEAYVHHYGWVRHPQVMQEKIKAFHQLWHSDEWIAAQAQLNQSFDYNEIDSVVPYTHTHPQVMKERIMEKNWDFKPLLNRKEKNLKKKFLFWVEEKTGYRIGEYKNYIRI